MVQVGDYEQVIVKFLLRVQYNYIHLKTFYKVLWWSPQVYNQVKEYEGKYQDQNNQGREFYVQNDI